jgi:hypothetical protein
MRPNLGRYSAPFLFAAVVILAGIGFADWPWSVEIALRLLFGAGALAFLILISNAMASVVIGRLRAEKAGLTRHLDASRRLLERVATRQMPSFDERIELTVVVGDDDAGDLVDQRIWTNPTPQLAHRVMRPIVPDDRVYDLDELDFECAVIDGAETTVTAYPLWAEPRRLLLLLDFEPIAHDEIEWRVRYHPRGLWRPLRATGRDYLAWDDQSPKNAYGCSPLRDFKITFVFPGTWKPQVIETRQYGKTEARKQRDDGRWVIEWHDKDPGGHRYQWELYRIAPPNLDG